MKYLITLLLLFISTGIQAEKKLIRKSEGGIAGRHGLFCLDSMHCISVDNFGDSRVVELFETFDQGETWSLKKEFRPKEELEEIVNSTQGSFILDDKHWYFEPEVNGKYIFFTEDGGETFHYKAFPHVVNLADIYMYSPKKGVLIHDYYGISVTFDGWETWETTKIEDVYVSYNVLMRTDSLVYITGNINIEGGEQEWFNCIVEFNIYTKESEILFIFPDESEQNGVTINSNIFHFYNDSLGFFWGGVRREGDNHYTDIIYKTTDGGHIWKEVLDYFEGDSWSLHGLAMRDSLYGMAVGQGGKYYETFDGGETWILGFFENNKQHLVMDIKFAGQKAIVGSMPMGMHHWEEVPDDTTGINEQARQIRVKHKNNHLFIFSSFNNLRLSVYNLSGQLLVDESIYQSGYTSLSKLQTGTYIYTIELGGIFVKSDKFHILR
jgi:photosystem II stability/assembly factor-like uncharacterized protein